MARYILIDNCSGYIWGDTADIGDRNRTDIDNPIEAAAALDAHIGLHTPRTYEEVGPYDLASNETGYHVYRADVNGSDAVPVCNDGQDKEMIAAVQRDCDYVTTIRCTDAEG